MEQETTRTETQVEEPKPVKPGKPKAHSDKVTIVKPISKQEEPEIPPPPEPVAALSAQESDLVLDILSEAVFPGKIVHMVSNLMHKLEHTIALHNAWSEKFGKKQGAVK